MFKKILIANRGEIAVRLIKACRELEIISACIYSEADKQSLHVRAADEAYLIGAAESSESYLHINKIIKLACEIGADAIHPGYGFLSENEEFISKIKEHNLEFIGPSSESVKLMGSKTIARQIMSKNGVPIVPGSTKPIKNLKELNIEAARIGLPVMLKASAGGGGKGMRRILKEEDLEKGFDQARNEAKKAFGDDAVYLEKYIQNPRHIEVQILGDKFGNYMHLFERECSIQRRHQKIIEEAPATRLPSEVRQKLLKTAIEAAKAVNYYNAGTIEFLVDGLTNEFYFLEMNTRLQVEHPVTEFITGVDIVKEQILIAQGNKLSIINNLKSSGHSIECRIYAEDSENNFMPSTGKILHHRMPSGPGIRIDRGIDLQSEVSIYYDPILSKVITYGSTRQEAIQRMRRALKEYKIGGVMTNIPVLLKILNNDSFKKGEYNINFISENYGEDKIVIEHSEEEVKIASIIGVLLEDKKNRFKPAEIKCLKNNNWNKQ